MFSATHGLVGWGHFRRDSPGFRTAAASPALVPVVAIIGLRNLIRTLLHTGIADDLCPSRTTNENGCLPITRICGDDLWSHMRQKVVTAILCSVGIDTRISPRRSGAALLQPEHVAIVRRRGSQWQVLARLDGRFSARVEPAFDLRMAVCKRDAAGAIVIAGRYINQLKAAQIPRVEPRH